MLKAPSPWNVFVILLVSALLQAGTATAADFSGTWQGTWTSYSLDSDNLAVTITQSGSSLSGSLDVSGTDCISHPNFTDLPLTGSVTGDSTSFQVSDVYCADEGGSLNDLVYTNGNLSGSTINGNYTIYSNETPYDSGTFRLTRTCCTVDATAGAGGSITPDGSIPKAPGESLSFTITPNTGYAVSDVKIDGVSQGAISNYTFTDVQADHTIEALFDKSGSLPFIPILLDE